MERELAERQAAENKATEQYVMLFLVLFKIVKVLTSM